MQNKTWLFESAPVPKAVLELAIPTVISQIIAMVYNMTDTFFVGQLNDPNQVAAVSLAAPLMLVMTALANLLGIGGASLASRSLGEKNQKKAEQSSAFSFYTALATAIICSFLYLALQPGILNLLGAVDEMRDFTQQYIFLVIVIGGAPLLLSMVLAHFVRADGSPRVASFGLSMGGIINMMLDPIFIFKWGLGMGVAGAASATLIANTVTLIYFLRYYIKNKADTILALNPKNLTLNKEISMAILLIGFPSMLQTLLASVSNAVLNRFASAYGGALVSGIGIAKKLDTIPMNVTIGFSQGVLPLLGYNFSAKNIGRMQKAVKFTMAMSVGFSVLCVCIFEIFTAPFVRLFIEDPETVAYGVYFLRIMCISTPLMAVGFLTISLFQAVGEVKRATILSVLRKGVVDIPLIILISYLFPLYGLAFVQPITECIAMTIAMIMYTRFSKHSKAQQLNLTLQEQD